MEVQEAAGVFKFTAIDGAGGFPLSSTREGKERMQKWNMDAHTVFKRFRFDERWTPAQAAAFALDFFNDPSVQAVLQTSESGSLRPVSGRCSAAPVVRLSTSVTSMDFFDRLVPAGIAAESGYIRKMFDDVVDGVTCSDKLRDMLLNDASENFQLYSEHERAEFIFHLLLRFAIGGSLCQCDDALTEYMLAVKAAYKEMLSVQKNPANNHVEVTSLVYQLSELDGDFKIFKEPNRHNYAYLIIDPVARRVTYWAAAFVPFW